MLDKSKNQHHINPCRTLLMVAIMGLQACHTTPHATQNQPNLPEDQQRWVDACEDWDDWDKAGPPFRLYANTYYVGTCGISTLLITGQQGHVLIDGGTEAGAAVVARNIQQLGFELQDIKLLLHSHEHFDHVAGLAELQRRSGARLLASAAAKPVLVTGQTATDDPQAGMHAPFPAARVDGLVNDGQEVVLGDIKLQAMATPGHAPGALSWRWQACQAAACQQVVYADSLSPVSSKTYRFSDHIGYLRTYRLGLERLSQWRCDLLVAPHPSAAGMRQKLLNQTLLDANSCQTYARKVTLRLDDRLAEENQEQH